MWKDVSPASAQTYPQVDRPVTLAYSCAMAKPKSEDRRKAILAAAARVFATQGLGAPTLSIAKEAGVSNGSLFGYFDTKATLLNALFVDLKTEMGAAAIDGPPEGSSDRYQLQHLWNGWLDWATSFPEKRRALCVRSSCRSTGPSERVSSPASRRESCKTSPTR